MFRFVSWFILVQQSNQPKHFSFIGNLLPLVFGKKQKITYSYAPFPPDKCCGECFSPTFVLKSVKEIWVTCLLWIVKNKWASQALGLCWNLSQRPLLITQRVLVSHFLILISQMGMWLCKVTQLWSHSRSPAAHWPTWTLLHNSSSSSAHQKIQDVFMDISMGNAHFPGRKCPSWGNSAFSAGKCREEGITFCLAFQFSSSRTFPIWRGYPCMQL